MGVPPDPHRRSLYGGNCTLCHANDAIYHVYMDEDWIDKLPQTDDADEPFLRWMTWSQEAEKAVVAYSSYQSPNDFRYH